MARIYLGDSGSEYVIGNSGTEVYGTDSRKDSIILNSDVRDVDIQSTVERLTLKEDLSSYQFKQGFGSNLEILDSAGNILAKMVSLNGKIISIDGEEFNLYFEDGVASIGENKLSTEPITIESSPSSSGYLISDGGITLASDEKAEVFTVVSGSSYTHKINNFDIFNDKLDFGEDVTAENLNLVNSSDDGRVSISYSPDMGSTTIEIELTGLSLKDDAALTTKDGLNSILYGYTPLEDEGENDYVGDISVGDAGDTVSDATEIEIDSDLFIKGYSADSDNYSFVATSDGTLSLDLYGMSADLEFLLYNSENIAVGTLTEGEGSKSILSDLTAGEKYTIAIEANSELEETSYNLYGWLKEVEEVEEVEGSGEPVDDENDDYLYSFEEAKYISLGDVGDLSSPTSISLGDSNDAYIYGYASDEDAYSFVATKNGSASIYLYGMEENLDLLLSDTSGETLAFSANYGTDEDYISYEVSAGEIYTVSVLTVGMDMMIGTESVYDLSLYIA